jgi:hypothetical protein
MATALVRPPLCVIVVSVVESNGRWSSNHVGVEGGEVRKESCRVEAVAFGGDEVGVTVGRSRNSPCVLGSCKKLWDGSQLKNG